MKVFVPFDEQTLPLAEQGDAVELVPFRLEYACFRAFRTVEQGARAGASWCQPLTPVDGEYELRTG